MLKVNSDIPIPKPVRPAEGRGRKYPFATMGVGEMFFVPDKDRNILAPYAASVGAQLGRKFITRLTHMRPGRTGWEPAEEGTKDAVPGIGVWRKE